MKFTSKSVIREKERERERERERDRERERERDTHTHTEREFVCVCVCVQGFVNPVKSSLTLFSTRRLSLSQNAVSLSVYHGGRVGWGGVGWGGVGWGGVGWGGVGWGGVGWGGVGWGGVGWGGVGWGIPADCLLFEDQPTFRRETRPLNSLVLRSVPITTKPSLGNSRDSAPRFGNRARLEGPM